MLHKKTPNLPPLTPPANEVTERILATYDRYLEFNPNLAILVGSAALALHGVYVDESDRLDDETQQRPRDLDFAATPLYMSELLTNGTPTGLPATIANNTYNQHVLKIETPIMPVDVISRVNEKNNPDLERYSRKFSDYIAKSGQEVDGSNLRVLSLNAIIRELRRTNSIHNSRLHNLKEHKDLTNAMNRKRDLRSLGS